MFAFYTAAGELNGPAASLVVEDFWDLGPHQADGEEPDAG